MSYGQNQPAGLVPVNTNTSAIYNGQNRQYYIKSGYGFNIFRGDVVYAGDDGYIHSLAELTSPTWQTATILGVFNGCSYAQPVSQNPTDYASPARPYWPAGTVVTNNPFGATASIIDDPSVIYTIQTNVAGAAWTNQFQTAAVGFTLDVSGNPQGNTNSGQSSMFLDGNTFNTGGTPTLLNLKVIGFDPTQGNPIPLPNAGVEPYVNLLVMIQNHFYATRPAGVA